MIGKQEFSVTVDALIAGLDGEDIGILLVRRRHSPDKDLWAIPGGFVEIDEALHNAAIRELNEETGLVVPFLQQYQAFGEPDRDPRGRTVSIAFFGLVRQTEHVLQADSDAADAQWFPVNQLPVLAFDHNQVLDFGLDCIRNALKYDRSSLEPFQLSDQELDLIEQKLTF